MKSTGAVRLLFFLAAAYDGVLGVVFLMAPTAAFGHYGVTPPNHIGYVQFPAAILIVFAIMFGAIAYRPIENRTLIPYGILLKLSYCGVIFGHWLARGIPDMWKPFAICDLAFAALFLWAWVALGRATTPRPGRPS